jgi:HlyD family secretion protein
MSNNSSVDSARAQLAQAEASLAALQDGPAENQLAGTRSQLRTAELQLEQAENRLADAILVAPFDGTVTDVAIVEDQQVGTGTVAVTLVEDTQLHVMTRVDELDISSVAIGQPATVTLDALDEMTLAGEVSRIAPQATTQQGITTYDVRVNLTETAENLRLGMSADVEILVDTLQDVLVVPRRAIQRNDELGEFITVQSGDSERDVAVTPGYSAGGLIVVEGDIEVGQTVIIPEDNR